MFNGVARTSGPESSSTTLEGIPANVVLPTVNVTNSSTLLISWQEPLTPNGEIVLYIIFVNSLQILNATTSDTFVHSGLTPFTIYTVQLQACTEFGCNRSGLVSVSTLEASPVGLAPPVVTITSSSSANISWGKFFQKLYLNAVHSLISIFIIRFSTATQWDNYRISASPKNASTMLI